MRLFVAAYPPEDACAHLAAMVDGLAISRAAAGGVNARVAPRSNWHVTLAFLGEVPDERYDDVREALTSAVSRWRVAGGTPPGLAVAGGGRFGRGRFTILWAGIRGEVDALRALATTVRRQVKRARLPFDSKPLRPHLTLARPGDRVDIRADLATLRDYSGPEWTVTELRLMRSNPGPAPTYDRLADFPLG